MVGSSRSDVDEHERIGTQLTPMLLIGFLQAQNCTNLPASWRHPESRSDFLSADYYPEIARVLERGKFHLAFFDDRLAMPDRYGDDHAAHRGVRHSLREAGSDRVLMAMAHGDAASRAGRDVLDDLLRAVPRGAAVRHAGPDDRRAGGLECRDLAERRRGDEHGARRGMEHDLRYDRADEFMEVVLGHWDAWEDDALVVDKASGRFADPERSRGSTTRGSTSRRADRSRCRARRRATRW